MITRCVLFISQSINRSSVINRSLLYLVIGLAYSFTALYTAAAVYMAVCYIYVYIYNIYLFISSIYRLRETTEKAKHYLFRSVEITGQC